MTPSPPAEGSPAEPRTAWSLQPLTAPMAVRPELSRRLTTALVSPRAAIEPVVVGLEGMGGCGKTTLAIQVCGSTAVRDAFPGGVIWATVGANREGAVLAETVNGLCYELSGEKVVFSDPLQSGEMLGKLLDASAKLMLLVVDDVWSGTQLKPFLIGGGNCRRLVITRNRNVAPRGAEAVEVEEMTEDEAVATLTRGVHGLSPETVSKLIRLVARWPLLLGLINGQIAEYVSEPGGPTAEEAAAWIAGRLERDGPVALDMDSPDDRAQAVAATVLTSLELLTTDERRSYQDLAIFPAATDIPASVLDLLWVGSGRLTSANADRLRRKLTTMRLAAGRWRAGGPAVRLHDVFRDYLRHEVGPDGLARRNAMFIRAASQLLQPGSAGSREGNAWWSLPPDAEYLWLTVAYHLQQARFSEELAETVTDLRWVEAKINVTGTVVGVEADLVLADSDDARQLRRELGRSAPILTPAEPPGTLAATLVSKLAEVPGVEHLARAYEQTLDRPRLENWLALPDRPDPALIRTLAGHGNWIRSCSFTADGALLATASDDKTVRVWDTDNGQLRKDFAAHAKEVMACAFAPAGDMLATGGYDGAVRLWRAGSGRLVAEADGGHSGRWVRCCAFAPAGDWLATAGDDGMAKIWEVPSGRLLATLAGHAGVVRACAFLSRTSLITIGDDGTARIWDVVNGRGHIILEGLSGTEPACALSASGRLAAVAGADCTIQIWDIVARRAGIVLEGMSDTATACAFSPDGELVAAACDGSAIRIWVWEVSTGQLRAVYHGGHTTRARTRACAFSPDSELLVAGGDDRMARIWQVGLGSAGTSSASHEDWVRCCAFSPDGLLVVTAGDDGTARIWDAASGAQRVVLAGHEDWVRCCAFSPDGLLVVTAGDDGTARIWDAASGAQRVVLGGAGGWISACAFSRDGGWVITGGFGRTIRLYDSSSWELRRELPAQTGPVFACSVSPDGSWLAVAGADRAVRIWDLVTGRVRTQLRHPDWVRGCAFSPDGAKIATTGDDGMVRVWDVGGGAAECVAALQVAQPLFGCDWHPAGDVIYAGGHAGVYGFRFLALCVPAVRGRRAGATRGCLRRGGPGSGPSHAARDRPPPSGCPPRSPRRSGSRLARPAASAPSPGAGSRT
jgi:WD40 repeat protein